MSDLIDRQAAIDAIKIYWKRVIDDIPKDIGFEEMAKRCDLALEHNSGILKAINNLPSAQPEPKWIPCSERLPEDGTWNIFSDGKNISVERYKMDAFDHFFPQGRWFSLDEAIAWMPLPEPYREDIE